MNELFGISTSLVTRDMPGTTLNAPREVEPKFRGVGMARSAEARISDVLASFGRESWMGEGRCAEADPEAWFPEKGTPAAAAKAICAGCEVAEQCLKYAMDNHENFGVWGGLTARERHALRMGRAA